MPKAKATEIKEVIPVPTQEEQWNKVKQVITAVYQNKIDAEVQKRDRVLLATNYIQQEDPNCAIKFVNDPAGNSYNVTLDYNTILQSAIDQIMATGEYVPEIPKELKKKKK